MKKLLTTLSILYCCARAYAVGPALLAHGGNAPGTVTGLNGTGGNLIALCADGNYPSYPSAVPTDSSGNTYSPVLVAAFPGESGVTLWVTFNPTVTSSMTFNSNSFYPLAVMIFSGVASGPDQTNTSNTLASGNITPTNANELIISCISPSGTSAPSGVTPLTLADSVASPGALASAYQIQTTATTVQATWTGTGNPSNLIASFYSDESPAPLVATTTAVPEGFVSTAYGSTSSLYSNQLAASGGAPPYTWTCPSTCALPGTLSLSSGGLITGTPTASQSAVSTTFRVTDSQSNTANVTLPITIASTAFSVSAGSCTGSALNGTQLSAYGGCTLSATGGTSPYTFSVSNNSNYPGLPYGMILNSSTGAITAPVIGGQGDFNPLLNIQDSLGALGTTNPQFLIAGNNTTSALPWLGSIFSTRVDALPVDTSPAAPVNSSVLSEGIRLEFGASPGSGPNGIPFLVVPYNQTLESTGYYYPLCSIDSACYQQYFLQGPWSNYAPIEDSWNCPAQYCDHHSLIVQDAGGGNPAQLWEFWEGNFGYSTGTGTGATFTPGTPGVNGPWVSFSQFYLPNLSSTDKNYTLSSTFTMGSPVVTATVPPNLQIGDPLSAASYITPGTTVIVGSTFPSQTQYTMSTNAIASGTTTVTFTNPAYLMPPLSYGSTDAAGLPVSPLLATADEVIGTGTPSAPNGAILHPIRFADRQPLHRFVWPATVGSNGLGACSGGYSDSNDMLLQANPPTSCSHTMPFGEIYRIKSSVVNPSCASTSPQAAIFITAMRDYGIIMSDIAGFDLALISTPDSRWNDSDLACLNNIIGSDFEPVNVSSIAVNLPSTPSEIGSYQTTSTPQSGTPTFSPAAGAVTNPTTVTASTSTSGCGSYIYFDTNPTPTTNTTTYNVTTAVTLYAYVHGCPGYTDSSVGSAAYTITGTPPPGVAPQLFY